MRLMARETCEGHYCWLRLKTVTGTYILWFKGKHVEMCVVSGDGGRGAYRNERKILVESGNRYDNNLQFVVVERIRRHGSHYLAENVSVVRKLHFSLGCSLSSLEKGYQCRGA